MSKAKWHILSFLLRHFQDWLLRRTLKRASRQSTYYRKKWSEMSEGTPAIRRCEDLGQLGFFTTSADLQSDPDAFCTRKDYEDLFTMRTTGSTGQPKIIRYSQEDFSRWSWFLALSFLFSGDRRGGSVQVLFCAGTPEWMTGDLIASACRKIGTRVLITGNDLPVAEQLESIRANGISTLYGTPSYLRVLTLEGAKLIDLATLGLRRICLGGEKLTEELRRFLTEQWGADVFDGYGSMEFGASVAGEIYPLSGLFFCPGVVPEVIDPETGDPVGAGERGELVLTSLLQSTTPLIRYRTGDLVIWKPASPDYAVPTHAVETVLGRIDDMITLGSGENVVPQLFEQVFHGMEAVRDFQVVVRRKDGRDHLTIRLEPATETERNGVTDDAIRKALFAKFDFMEHDIRKSGTLCEPEIEWVPPGQFFRERPIKHKQLVDSR